MESISDDFDVSSLLDTDDQLSFRRPGIGVESRAACDLATGAFSASWDLHGLRVDEARRRWANSSATRTSWACAACAWCTARASSRQKPGAKGRVQSWLVQKEGSGLLCRRPIDGGARGLAGAAAACHAAPDTTPTALDAAFR